MSPSLPRALAAAALAVLASATPALASAKPSPPTLALPAPTGAYPVGAATLHLVDQNRADPWTPAERRQLMVSLWYPAKPSDKPRARYMTPEESAALLAAEGVEGMPPDALSHVRTNARAGAAPARTRLPVVLLSPGFGAPRSSLTALGEELASRGYLAAAVDHTYEAAGVTLPDGRTAPCKACEITDSPGLVPAIRSADMSFVIDRLGSWGAPGQVDTTRIAMVGHSIGGNSAARAMVDDPRIDAGANMDGSFIEPLPAAGLARPFLLFGTATSFKPGSSAEEPSWGANWPRLTGWKRWLTVAGSDHDSFTDYPLLKEQAGLPAGQLPGARAVKITRAYVRAFVDRHLRGRPTTLLDGPRAAFPEVRRWP